MKLVTEGCSYQSSILFLAYHLQRTRYLYHNTGYVPFATGRPATKHKNSRRSTLEDGGTSGQPPSDSSGFTWTLQPRLPLMAAVIWSFPETHQAELDGPSVLSLETCPILRANLRAEGPLQQPCGSESAIAAWPGKPAGHRSSPTCAFRWSSTR